jgi:nucleoside-diphosphate-sugar epimerase
MKILITGGGGFLGARLARTLLSKTQLKGQTITAVMLADQQAPPEDLLASSQVHVRTGPLLAQVAELASWQPDAVFHLASAVSGECEED